MPNERKGERAQHDDEESEMTWNDLMLLLLPSLLLNF
jgi:hypothetical protein